MQFQEERGFSLVEVLVSVVILSIVSVSLISIFSQSLRSTRESSDETVAANLAFHAASYLQQEAIDDASPLKYATLQALVDDGEVSPPCAEDASNACQSVFEPVINGKPYSISIRLTDYTKDGVKEPHLIQSKIVVRDPQQNSAELVAIEGVISSAALNEEFPFTLSE